MPSSCTIVSQIKNYCDLLSYQGHLHSYLLFSTAFEPRQSAIGDQYFDFDKHKQTGAPTPLADRPIITKMSDSCLTLCWKPSISTAPRVPVTYQVELLELPEGRAPTISYVQSLTLFNDMFYCFFFVFVNGK